MKFINLLLLFISVDAKDVIKNTKFSKVQRVSQHGLSAYKLKSSTGMRSSFECAIQCEKDGCVSFAYTKVDKRCDTYSQWLGEDTSAEVSSSTIYFTQGPNICQGVSSGLPAGQYLIKLQDGSSVHLVCDMDAPEGPWAVIHRRTLGNVNFNRNWAECKAGFGNLDGDFWIGNEIIHKLTSTPSILRVELETWQGLRAYAQYSTFKVASESENYKLLVQGFSGNVSRDAMVYSNGFGFTTFDKDNDGRDPTSKNCALERQSPWWHNRCTLANLMGVYEQEDGNSWTAMSWVDFPGDSFTPLKKARMMIRWMK